MQLQPLLAFTPFSSGNLSCRPAVFKLTVLKCRSSLINPLKMSKWFSNHFFGTADNIVLVAIWALFAITRLLRDCLTIV